MAKFRLKEGPCPATGCASTETRVGAVESRDLARTALEASLASKNLLSEAGALFQMGRIFTSSVDPQAALDAVTRAGQIFIAHSAPVHAAKCSIAAARALMDLGQERDAAERARRALNELSLPPEHRVAGMILLAHSHAHFGKLDAALHLLLHSAVPLAENSGRTSRIHVRKALAVVHFKMLLALEFPHLHRGLSFVCNADDERSRRRQVLDWLDATDDELPIGERWSHVEIMRHLTLGLCEPGDLAFERLASVGAEQLATDPPTAAWAWYAQSLVHRNRRDLVSAQDAIGRCLTISERWGLKAVSRYAFLQQSLIRESTEDYCGSLESYKIFSTMRLRSVTASNEAIDPDPTARLEPNDPRAETKVLLMKPLESRHVKRALRFIESNLSVPISVSDIAAECQVSRRTLEVAFKQHKSCTLANYVKRRRLETAAGLLGYSALLVSEVATAVGYRWPSAFARDFVTHYGVRPSEWRARHGGQAMADSADDF